MKDRKAQIERLFFVLIVAFLLSFWQRPLFSQSLSSNFYQIGTPRLEEYYVDPISGRDANSGRTISSPRRSVSSIWNEIPDSEELSSGIRINLLPGIYGSDHLPNYWENKTGTALAPIILSATEGYGTVFFTRDINMSRVSFFYLLGIDIKNRTSDGYGDAFHAERSDHILLRGNSFNGAPNGRNAGGSVAHETIKFNQSSNIYLENNNIQGAEDNAIDFVAVYGGHIRSNRIHDSQSWCAYVKGGSSYILIEGNIAYNCSEGGITAGQGTGFEFMDMPYLRYEANYIKIVNNIIYDIYGAALGVNGGYNILIAHNTAYRVGSRSHLIEVVFGERSCDGDISACQTRRELGGWGPVSIGSEASQPIGNKNVSIFNNIIYNPAGLQAASQHFAIYGPRVPTVSGIPSPQLADDALVIKGNLIWNGSGFTPLGIEEEDQGCQIGNVSCNQSKIISENTINTIEPDFVSAASYDFRPLAFGALSSISSAGIADFSSLDSIAGPIPEGDSINQLAREFSGQEVLARPPGAIANSNSSILFPSLPDSSIPPDGQNGLKPTVKISKVIAKRKADRITISITAIVNDSDGISTVKASLLQGKKTLAVFALRENGSKFFSKKTLKTKSSKLKLKVTATDKSGRIAIKFKSIAV